MLHRPRHIRHFLTVTKDLSGYKKVIVDLYKQQPLIIAAPKEHPRFLRMDSRIWNVITSKLGLESRIEWAKLSSMIPKLVMCVMTFFKMCS